MSEERPMAEQHSFPDFDDNRIGGSPSLSIRWSGDEIIAERNGEEVPIDEMGVSLCVELLRVAAERDRRDAVLREAIDLAWEWAAGYPLGGSGDAAAAKEVYEKCSEAAELLQNREVRAMPEGGGAE